MRKLITLAVVVCVTTCLGFGDYAPLTEGSTFQNSKFTLQLLADPSTNTLMIYFKLKYYGPFGIKYAGSLTSDADVMRPIEGGIELIDAYFQAGHKAPSADIHQNLKLLGFQTDLINFIAAKYSKPLISEDPADAAFELNEKFNLQAIYPADSSPFSKQRYKRIPVEKDLNNSLKTVLEDPTGQVDLGLMHGLLLTIAWCFIADIGVWIKYVYEFKQRVLAHSLLMTLSLVLSLAMQGLALYGMDITLDMFPQIESAHVVIGLIALAWISLQFLLGIASRILLTSKSVSPKTIRVFRMLHRISGYILLLVVKVNVLIGWWMGEEIIAFGVLLAEIVLVLILRMLYMRRMSQAISGKEQEKEELNKKEGSQIIPEGEHIRQLMELPYTRPQVQEKHVLVFDDKVYAVRPDDFHPGGRKIIDIVNGREVDRFIYGMFAPQLLPEINPFHHPKKALLVLDTPIYALPSNPVCTLPASDFFVKSRLQVTKDFNIFYFEPFGGKIVYEPIRSSLYIGQYFCVTDFGMTRLYTCVLSQLKTNRRLCQKIIEQITHSEVFLQNHIPFSSNAQVLTTEVSVMQLNEPPTHFSGQEECLPLIIKHYPNRSESFTRKLYTAIKPELSIRGPKGRGLCIEQVPKGDIVLIAGGTGLFPFLDLLDLLFKATVAGQSKTQIPNNELEVARSITKFHVFHVFISVASLQELIIPDQLNLICRLQPAFVKLHIRIREGVPAGTFEGALMNNQTRFGKQLVKEMVVPLKNLQMVYICGTQDLYKDMHGHLTVEGITSDRIFFV